MSRLALLVAAFLLGLPALAQADVFDAPVAPALAGTLPPGFTETTVWSGLGNPTAVRFAPDGRVFVASKSGIVNVFDGLSDTTPTQFADLRTRVHDFWDRGLLGLALDPGFTSGRPYVYVLYAYDKAPNSSQQPRWGDGCPSPPGATDDGCVITGRLSRLNAAGAETVLIEDFCQQYPSHSLGTIDFGPDGMLYVSSGDGASFNWADYGQDGNPVNPVRRPGAGGRRAALAELPPRPGAATRRSTARSCACTPTRATRRPATRRSATPTRGAGGSSPTACATRSASPSAPARARSGRATSAGTPTRRSTARRTSRRSATTAGPVTRARRGRAAYDSLNLASCETLYSAGTATTPYFSYKHSEKVVPGESCSTGSSSISGLAFYTADVFPPAYKHALFFSDYSRNCIWVMYRGANGLPDPATRADLPGRCRRAPCSSPRARTARSTTPTSSGGRIRRIAADNATPTARIAANPTSGTAPLTVAFSGTGSSDPESQPLTYAWDLDGDGAYDDSTAAAPSLTYTTAGVVTVRLRVSDPGGLQATTSTTITVGGPPMVTIAAPSAAVTWAVGDTISFAGSARNSAGATLPASALRWSLSLRHCSRDDANVCHTHAIQDYVGVASGHFVAPDHEYPSHLLLSLTATDGAGLSTTETMRLNPRTANVTLASVPPGLQLSFASETLATPFTRTVIARSVTSVQRAVPAGARRRGLPVGRVERRARADARRHRAGLGIATFTATYAGTAASDAAPRRDRPRRPARVHRAAGHRRGLPRDRRPRPASRARCGCTSTRTSEASELVLALYSERQGEEPAALLATGRNANPLAGGWNAVELETGVPLVAGRPYWIGLLNPLGSGGPLRWRDRAADVGHRGTREPEHDADRAAGQLEVERDAGGTGRCRRRCGASPRTRPRPTRRPRPSRRRRPRRSRPRPRPRSRRRRRRRPRPRLPAPTATPRPAPARSASLGLRRPHARHRRPAQRRRPLRPRARLRRPRVARAARAQARPRAHGRGLGAARTAGPARSSSRAAPGPCRRSRSPCAAGRCAGRSSSAAGRTWP